MKTVLDSFTACNFTTSFFLFGDDVEIMWKLSDGIRLVTSELAVRSCDCVAVTHTVPQKPISYWSHLAHFSWLQHIASQQTQIHQCNMGVCKYALHAPYQKEKMNYRWRIIDGKTQRESITLVFKQVWKCLGMFIWLVVISLKLKLLLTCHSIHLFIISIRTQFFILCVHQIGH